MNTLRIPLLLLATLATLQSPAASATTDGACYSRQELAARSQGFVDQVKVKDGDLVKKGDLLVQLDDRLLVAGWKEAKAGLQAAKADLRLADDALRRLRQLKGTDTVTEQELVQAEVRHEQAKAQLARAEAVLERVNAQLADTRVKAELDGRISGLPSAKGLYVQAGQSLGRIEATGTPCQTAAAR